MTIPNPYRNPFDAPFARDYLDHLNRVSVDGDVSPAVRFDFNRDVLEINVDRLLGDRARGMNFPEDVVVTLGGVGLLYTVEAYV